MIRSALLAIALASPAAAQTAAPPDLQGEWMGFAASAILLGLVVPVIEELSVAGATATQRGWTVPMDPADCTGAPTQPAGCAPPIELGTVRLALAKGLLEVAPAGEQPNPYPHPTDAARWPLVALAGHGWQVRAGATTLVLSREAEVEGEAITLDRLYVRAPAGAAGWLFDYLQANELSVGRAICGVQALQDDPADWHAFVDRLALLAPVTAELARLGRGTGLGREDRLRLMTLREGPQVLGEMATDVSDIPEAARVAWLDHLAWLRAGAAPAPGQGVIAALGWQAAPDVAERAEACLEYYLSD
jgi:hypothetical protein